MIQIATQAITGVLVVSSRHLPEVALASFVAGCVLAVACHCHFTNRPGGTVGGRLS
jgi:hypothetical protein